MRVRVLLFGALREAAGRAEEWLEMPDGAKAADVLARFGEIPRVRALLPSLAIAVNQEYAGPEAQLHDGDELAFLPPVSGGLEEGQRDKETKGQRDKGTKGQWDESPSVQVPGFSGFQVPKSPDPLLVRLVREPIARAEVLAEMRHAADGALVVFEGVVRDHSGAQRTLFLEYEAFEPMARKELEKLAADARKRFAIREIAVVHRLGRLEIGETSVLIAVAAEHRAPAFEACRWAIDTLKHMAPIWKKEHFTGGSVWVEGDRS
jgi:molybdopterin synthase catalytic subunit